mgnify:CR=1 FL=1
MSELLSSVQAWLTAALASLVVLIAVFVPLERLFPARPQPIFRPALATDAAFYVGQYLLWNALSIAVLRFVAAKLGSQLVIPAPKIVLFLGAVVLGDLLVYWFHRACHASNLLWRFHSVHHSSEQLDFLAAHREHPVDGVLTQLMQNLPAIVLGVSTGGLAGLAVFRGMWAIFIHSNVRLPIGPLGYLLGDPALHHWHHARGHGLTNFGNLAPWLDVVFGTHEVPVERDYPLGIPNHPRRSWFGSMWTPFVR